jgi:hypothetical protein
VGRLRPAAAVLAAALAAPAAAFVPGGGLADTDCRVAFGDVDATAGASGVVCTDGDPACDADGTADGVCRFAPAICVGIPAPGCTPTEIDAIAVAGTALAPPPLPAPAGTCGPPAAVDLPAGTAAATTLVAGARGDVRDVDYLNLCCRTQPGALDATRCALAADLAASGCDTVPRAARRTWSRARALVDEAAASPDRAPALLRRAARRLRHVRAVARRLAKRDRCGFALGLMASHALDVAGRELP